jgi:hypothetical protein
VQRFWEAHCEAFANFAIAAFYIGTGGAVGLGRKSRSVHPVMMMMMMMMMMMLMRMTTTMMMMMMVMLMLSPPPPVGSQARWWRRWR